LFNDRLLRRFSWTWFFFINF